MRKRRCNERGGRALKLGELGNGGFNARSIELNLMVATSTHQARGRFLVVTLGTAGSSFARSARTIIEIVSVLANMTVFGGVEFDIEAVGEFVHFSGSSNFTFFVVVSEEVSFGALKTSVVGLLDRAILYEYSR